MCIAGAAAANADSDFRLLQIDGHHVKWGAPILGKGATITYAVVTAPSAISGSVNCLHISAVGRLLKRSHVTRKLFDRELAGALQMWQSAANLRFVPAKSVGKADIVFGAEADSGGIAFADVAFDRASVSVVSPLKRGIVCLNPDIQWSVTHDLKYNSTPGSAQRDTYRLRYTLAHEIGHVLGLDHPGPDGELMSFEYGQKLDGLGKGDISGITTLYGRRSAIPVIALNSKSAADR
jgi:hypothetical protein